MNIDIRWTDAARATVAGLGITFAEVINIIDDGASVQVHIGDGPARVRFLGCGHPGRVLVVTADRQARNIAVYNLAEIRLATPGETRAWEKRQQS